MIITCTIYEIVSWRFHDLELTLMSSKVKRHYVNWKAIYDFLYVFHIHFCHNMHTLWDTAHLKLNDLDLTFHYNPRSNVMRSTERQYMTSYMCFIQTLVITCTVSEIFAQIDHKSPNWTFLALNKGHLYWFHSLHILSQYWHHPNEVAWCKINGQHFSTAERFLIIW